MKRFDIFRKHVSIGSMIRSGAAIAASGMLVFATVASAADVGVDIGDDGEVVGSGSLSIPSVGASMDTQDDGEVVGSGSLSIPSVGVSVDSQDDDGEIVGSGDLDPIFVSDPVFPDNDDDFDDGGFGGGGEIIVIPPDEDDPTPGPSPTPVPTPAPKPDPVKPNPDVPKIDPIKPIGASYNISYEMNGGVNYGASPTSADHDQTFTVANPTRNGYVFLGWIVTGLDSSEHYVDYGRTTDTVLNYTYATNFCNLRATAGTVNFSAQWKIPATITGINGLVENGSAQALVRESGIPSDAYVDYTMNGRSVTFPSATSAGDYYIEYGISSPGVQRDVWGSLNVTIAKPAVKENLSVSGYNGTYDGNDHGVNVKVTPKGTPVEYSTNNSSWSGSAPRFRDATNQRVYVRLADNPNISASADVVINKKNASIRFSTNFPSSMNQNVTFSTDYTLDAGSQVTMTSSNPSILAVNYSGSNVTLTPGSQTGTVTITVKTDETTNYTGINQQCNVTVAPSKLIGITLNPSALSLATGAVGKFTVTGNPSNAAINNLSFLSSDPTVASVDAYGNVTAIKPGKVTIGAFSGDAKAAAIVEVYSPTVPTVTVALDMNTASIVKGQSFTLVTAVASNDNSLSKALTWSSTDPSVASVSNGNVKGLKEGVADITAKTVTGNTATCRVTVTKKQVSKVDAVLIDPTANIGVGETKQLSLSVYPEGVTDKITWSTTNTKIVIVNGGVIQGVAPGTAIIKAEASNGKYSTCAVTVFDLSDTGLAAQKAQDDAKKLRQNDQGQQGGTTSGSGKGGDNVSPENVDVSAAPAIWRSDNAPAQEDIFAANAQGADRRAENLSNSQAALKAEEKGFNMGLLVAALIGLGVAATAGIIFIARRRL